MDTSRSAHCCFIVPPDVLVRVADRGDADDRDAALWTLSASASVRTRRAVVGELIQANVQLGELAFLAPPMGENKTVYDVHHGGDFDLPGTKMRGEGDPPARDPAVNEAYDGADHTHDFYKNVFNRDSIDNRGMEMISSVHYGTNFDNALWNGSQMVYGDGSGRIIKVGTLTKDLSVMAHEMTHGVTQFTSGLRYSKQSGALNESFSDVGGSMVKQWMANETAEQADWLIGVGVLGSALHGQALRSMKAPGTAFDLDNQPDHMSHYVDLPDDNNPRNDHGGVHINSGIPNKAFYLVATEIGGHSWEQAGPIWYDAFTKRLGPNADFKTAARATIASAGELYGKRRKAEKAVRSAWKEVGVL